LRAFAWGDATAGRRTLALVWRPMLGICCHKACASIASMRCSQRVSRLLQDSYLALHSLAHQYLVVGVNNHGAHAVE